MIEKMASNLVNKIVSEQLLNEEQKEYYIYAGISIIERVITIGTICVLGLITNTFIYTVFFLLFFLELRKRAGGTMQI